MPEELLAKLRDIHLPEDPGWWPPAPGWWLVAALLLLTPIIGLALRAYRRRRPIPKYRSAALVELDQCYQQYQLHGDKPAFVQAVSVLLKRVAMQCYDPTEVAALSGKKWADFLGRDQETTVRETIRDTLEQAYSKQVDADAADFYQFAQAWISAQGKF